MEVSGIKYILLSLSTWSNVVLLSVVHSAVVIVSTADIN